MSAVVFVEFQFETLKEFDSSLFCYIQESLISSPKKYLMCMDHHLDIMQSSESVSNLFQLIFPRCIFSSQKLGTWQYLADIPFATISPRMLWRIFYTLHLDYQEESHGDFGGQVYDLSFLLNL